LAEHACSTTREASLLTIALQPLVALIAGILILLVPRLLNYIVAVYLIVVGVTGLWPNLLH
jgi:hypothetical protein